jgi:hypothetical protein
MIHLLSDLPRNVIGLEASGAVTGNDYRNMIVPRIEQTQHEFEKVRMLCIFDEEFEGFTPGAAWEDSKLAFKRPSSWERIAIVSDKESIRQATMLFGWMVPGEVKLFPSAEADEATRWVSAA